MLNFDILSAIKYGLNNKAEFYQCLNDARIPLDNNLTEGEEIKSFVIDRKNFLFFCTLKEPKLRRH